MAALAAVTAVSCSDKGSAENTANADKYSVPEATSDSVNSYFGSFVGTSILGEYSRLDSAMQAKQPKSDIVKGIQYVLGAPESEGVAVGMQIGLQMLNNLQRMEELGIKPDRNAIVNSFKKAFLADSTDMDAARGAQMAYQEMMGRIQRENKEFEDAKKPTHPKPWPTPKPARNTLPKPAPKTPPSK